MLWLEPPSVSWAADSTGVGALCPSQLMRRVWGSSLHCRLRSIVPGDQAAHDTHIPRGKTRGNSPISSTQQQLYMKGCGRGWGMSMGEQDKGLDAETWTGWTLKLTVPGWSYRNGAVLGLISLLHLSIRGFQQEAIHVGRDLIIISELALSPLLSSSSLPLSLSSLCSTGQIHASWLKCILCENIPIKHSWTTLSIIWSVLNDFVTIMQPEV